MHTAAVVFCTAICAVSMAQYHPSTNLEPIFSKIFYRDTFFDLQPHVCIHPVRERTVAITTTRLPATSTTIKKPVPVSSKAIDTAYVLSNSPFTCDGLKDGHYADVYFGCMFFHQCKFFAKDDGYMYVQQAVFKCGEGTTFNQTMRICAYSDKVSCDVSTVGNIIRYQLTFDPTSLAGQTKPIPITSSKCVPDQYNDGFYFAEEVHCKCYHKYSIYFPLFKKKYF